VNASTMALTPRLGPASEISFKIGGFDETQSDAKRQKLKRKRKQKLVDNRDLFTQTERLSLNDSETTTARSLFTFQTSAFPF
jgi:hypothetical protein